MVLHYGRKYLLFLKYQVTNELVFQPNTNLTPIYKLENTILPLNYFKPPTTLIILLYVQ